MVTDGCYQVVLGDLISAVLVQVRTHVETFDGERHKGADLAREHELVTKALQVDAQDLRQLQHFGVFHAVTQLLALLAAVHVVAFEFIGREERGQTVLQRDVRAPEPAANNTDQTIVCGSA